MTGLSGKNSTARTPSRSGWISMRGTCVLSRHTFCPISLGSCFFRGLEQRFYDSVVAGTVLMRQQLTNPHLSSPL